MKPLDLQRKSTPDWLTPFDGDGIEWHESLPSPYTYQESDFSKLFVAVHQYECRVRDLEQDRDMWKGVALQYQTLLGERGLL